MRISDQTAALKLAICDDIGERSYDFADVAAILVQILLRHPAVGEWFNSLKDEILCFVHSASYILCLLAKKTSIFYIPFHHQVWVLLSCICVLESKPFADGFASNRF
jgi:hypothetical protein